MLIWGRRYSTPLRVAKTIAKKELPVLFGYIFKSVFASSSLFCFITSQMFTKAHIESCLMKTWINVGLVIHIFMILIKTH